MTNRERIEHIYDAFARGDTDAVFGAMAPDVEWNEAEGNPYADGNPYRGPQAVGEGVFGRLLADYDGFAALPEQFVAEGDTVVALGRYAGTRTDGGQTLDAPFVHVWTLEGGVVTAFQQYTDTAQFRDHVGQAV